MTDQQPAVERKAVRMDLTPLLQGRVHLKGFDCQVLRGLRLLAGAVGMLPGGPKIEWVEINQTNPAKVTCANCWYENAEVQHAFALAHPVSVSRLPRVGR